jgi:hypothetical protein
LYARSYSSSEFVAALDVSSSFYVYMTYISAHHFSVAMLLYVSCIVLKL